MDECHEMLRQVMGTANQVTIATPGTGTSGMEAAVMNPIQPGDRAVIGICGYFGERIAQMAERAGGEVTVNAPWGSPVDP
jgi:alanine-glyoxylate transaminase/serine-glyoxylate transaminase/serine-pyruvate transaminase